MFIKQKYIFSNCFKLVWEYHSFFEKYPVKIVISVPKRLHKKAVTRNRLKRKVREAYRLNKNLLYDGLRNNKLSLNIMLIYNCKEELNYSDIENNLIFLMKELLETINNIK